MTKPVFHEEPEVSFGKYKNELVSTLLMDTAYCKWLYKKTKLHFLHPELMLMVSNEIGKEPIPTKETLALNAREVYLARVKSLGCRKVQISIAEIIFDYSSLINSIEITQKAIAKKLGVSSTTVNAAISGLTDKGLLSVVYQGKMKPHIYSVRYANIWHKDISNSDINKLLSDH